LNENFLREVFRLGDVARHAQAQRIYAAVVALVKLFEGRHVAFGSPLRQFVIRCSRCLSFACSHCCFCDRRVEPRASSAGAPLLAPVPLPA
ncbi:MAG: hypothetical protein QOH42_2003, partial [Blastocatellia bacterium]|nr:hypothetical protein [Blastocatellia bacterium]